MKYFLLMGMLSLFFLSCRNKNAETNGLALAKQVCECKMKTKGMKYEDPERKKLWSECLDLQGANYKKLENNKTELNAFNDMVKECLLELTVGK